MPEPANRKARDWAGCRTKACILLSLHNPGIRENCSFTSKANNIQPLEVLFPQDLALTFIYH